MADINTRKRGNKWEYYFEIAKIDGKRKRISKGGFSTKSEAVKAGSEVFPLGCRDHTLGGDVVRVMVRAVVLPDEVGSVAGVAEAARLPDKSGFGHWGSSFRFRKRKPPVSGWSSHP